VTGTSTGNDKSLTNLWIPLPSTGSK
jgi:hypothetical protein